VATIERKMAAIREKLENGYTPCPEKTAPLNKML